MVRIAGRLVGSWLGAAIAGLLPVVLGLNIWLAPRLIGESWRAGEFVPAPSPGEAARRLASIDGVALMLTGGDVLKPSAADLERDAVVFPIHPADGVPPVEQAFLVTVLDAVMASAEDLTGSIARRDAAEAVWLAFLSDEPPPEGEGVDRGLDFLEAMYPLDVPTPPMAVQVWPAPPGSPLAEHTGVRWLIGFASLGEQPDAHAVGHAVRGVLGAATAAGARCLASPALTEGAAAGWYAALLDAAPASGLDRLTIGTWAFSQGRRDALSADFGVAWASFYTSNKGGGVRIEAFGTRAAMIVAIMACLRGAVGGLLVARFAASSILLGAGAAGVMGKLLGAMPIGFAPITSAVLAYACMIPLGWFVHVFALLDPKREVGGLAGPAGAEHEKDADGDDSDPGRVQA